MKEDNLTAHPGSGARLKDRLIGFIQEEVPDHLDSFFYCLGATPLTLFAVAAATGILMTFYYIPFPGEAYESVRHMTKEVYLGWFIRGLHKISINLMIFTLFLHVMRVLITRAYRGGGEPKWLIGSLLFFTTLAMGFTGYSLVNDQVSYWGATVVVNMINEIPLLGPPAAYLLRGGEAVSEITLLRLYDLHTKLLPLVLVLLIGAHILVIRRLGFASIGDGPRKTHLFFPQHAMKTVLIGIALLIVMVNLVIIFPPELGPIANPQEVASDVSPPWYFLSVYKWITIAPRQPAMLGILFFVLLFIPYPYIDRFLSARGYDMTRVNILLGSVATAAFAALTLWNVIF